MLGERGQDRQRAVLALAEAEQAGELLADQLGGRAADRRRRRRRRQGGQAKRVVGLPGPVGGGAQEIGLALGGGAGAGARGPAAPIQPVIGERDLVVPGSARTHRSMSLLAVGGDGGAGDGDSEPPGEPGERGDLRHGEQAALAAAGLRVQRGERRIGGDQPAFGIDPAGDRPLALERGAHAASAAAGGRGSRSGRRWRDRPGWACHRRSTSLRAKAGRACRRARAARRRRRPRRRRRADRGIESEKDGGGGLAARRRRRAAAAPGRVRADRQAPPRPPHGRARKAPTGRR